jgi:hypothetical protein
LGPLKQGILETPGHTVTGHLVHGQVKEAPKFPHVFHKQLYLHGIFPSIDRKKHRSTGEY